MQGDQDEPGFDLNWRHVAGTIALVVAIQAAMAWLTYATLGDWSERSQFGEMFGVVNALFSGLAFAGVVWAILLQRHELALQRLELRLARDEARRSADALESSAQLLRDQISLLESQRVDQREERLSRLVREALQDWPIHGSVVPFLDRELGLSEREQYEFVRRVFLAQGPRSAGDPDERAVDQLARWRKERGIGS
jgi:hypothetical protein